MSGAKPKTWECKIGEVHPEMVPPGADSPMRHAVAEAYVRLTGQRPAFIFSGWGGSLNEGERAVHENRLPSEEWLRAEQIKDAAPDLLTVAKRALEVVTDLPTERHLTELAVELHRAIAKAEHDRRDVAPPVEKPELLTAALLCLDANGHLRGCEAGAGTDGNEEHCTPHCEALRKAVAKAEGRQS